MSDPLHEAAENMNWEQPFLNGDPPCFYLDEERGRFCARAKGWFGHNQHGPKQKINHAFVSLADLLREVEEMSR